MAANSTKNETPEVVEAETADPGEETVQVLFKVSKKDRNALKIVAMLEDKDGFQDLFSSISADLITKHAEALEVLTKARTAA